MSNVRILKEIAKKKIRNVYTLLCLRSAEFSKSFGSKISVVINVSMVQDCLNLAKNSNQNEIKYMYALRPNAAYLNSQCHTCMLQKI